MINITKQNSSKLKTQFNLGSELASNVAVYSNMSELNTDINNGKYNNLDYSIIFVGTSAYVIKQLRLTIQSLSLQAKFVSSRHQSHTLQMHQFS